MSTQILIKRSASAGSVPPSLAQGELALNLADGLMFWADTSGTVQSTPLKNLVTQSQLTALVGGAPAALDTLKELADAIGDDANFASTITTALGNRLRTDTAAQGLSATAASYARFNLGHAAPLKITSNVTLDPQLGLDREYEIQGAFTATAPAVSSVFDGWRTGTFHNRGNGSIATATFVGTIAVPSGAYLNGVLNGTKPLAYGQRGYLYYDAQATPNATWQWVWIDRCPLLLTQSYSAVGSFDFAIPSGYRRLLGFVSNFNPSVGGSIFGARLSGNGGTSVNSSGTDYYSEFVAGTAGSTGAASQALSFLQIVDVQSSGYTTSQSGIASFEMDLRYGTLLTKSAGVNTTPASYAEIRASFQATSPPSGLISNPNLLRFISSGGGTLSVDISLIGIPAQ